MLQHRVTAREAATSQGRQHRTTAHGHDVPDSITTGSSDEPDAAEHILDLSDSDSLGQVGITGCSAHIGCDVHLY